ncbi:hypothetical protein [Mobilicoccus pelagius]|uniref:Uncharacterized protein n=1 Tax=Mobilicoccus pelagius NBRC 104925 TaxID=1089455 RepID=H5UUI9_9MICO|nr:hypothetical protein [Mobilicoccus pelagius]GAB49397.1 hypothetical protein MOPEL_130_00040 [Mobilicoccus pelagius NBRC 104925]
MSVMATAGTRLYSVLLTSHDGRPGTWLTVAADDLVDAMRRAREDAWWGEAAPGREPVRQVSAVECLGLAWH